MAKLNEDDIVSMVIGYVPNNDVEVPLKNVDNKEDYTNKVKDICDRLSRAGFSQSDIAVAFGCFSRKVKVENAAQDEQKQQEELDRKAMIEEAKRMSRGGDGLISKKKQNDMNAKRDKLSNESKEAAKRIKDGKINGSVKLNVRAKRAVSWQKAVQDIARRCTRIDVNYSASANHPRKRLQEGADIEVKRVGLVFITIDHSGSMDGKFDKMLRYLPALLTDVGADDKTEVVILAWASKGYPIKHTVCMGPSRVANKAMSIPFINGGTDFNEVWRNARQLCHGQTPDLVVHMSDWAFASDGKPETRFHGLMKQWADKTLWISPAENRTSCKREFMSNIVPILGMRAVDNYVALT